MKKKNAPQVKTIISGLGRGLQLQFLPETPTELWFGTHEPWIQDAINRETQPGWVIYDCGANIGYYAAIFASAVGDTGKVFAFEPSPANYKCLEVAGELNGFRNIVPVNESKFTIDDFVYESGNPPPDLIKIELGEGKTLDGARRVLAEFRPRLILETHGEPSADVWNTLSALGYKVVNLNSSQYLAVPA